MLAIDKGVPKVLSLKEILTKYLEHQVEVIRRRTEFEKRKAEERAHILDGLRKALDVIDEIIAIIRGSHDSETAKTQLIEQFDFTPIQAQAILDMRLVRLTGLEREKIDAEFDDLMELIRRLTEILSNEQFIYEIIEDELTDIKHRFNDKRRTELRVGELTSIEDEDLIEEEDILIALTANGYIKRMTEDEFQVQNRGGRGVKGMGMGDGDDIQTLVSCSTHDTLLFFTNKGKVYQSKGYDIPEYGRTAKGIPVINLLNIEKNEYVKEIISLKQQAEPQYLFFVTKEGVVKRSDAKSYQNIRNNGLIALSMREEDELINVLVTDGSQAIIIGSHSGFAMTFAESEVRVMGRTATGVRGIKLRKNDYVVGAAVLNPESEVLVVTERGYGKRTPATEYALKRRGGMGIKTAKISDKSGKLAGIVATDGKEDLMIMTDQGVVIRFNIASISLTSRATLGVKMIRLDKDAKVSSVTKIMKTDDSALFPQPGSTLTSLLKRIWTAWPQWFADWARPTTRFGTRDGRRA